MAMQMQQEHSMKLNKRRCEICKKEEGPGIECVSPFTIALPFTCRIGFHDYIGIGDESVTYQKRGPFDPRDDENRTWTREMEICARCGKKRERQYDPYPGY